MPQFIKLAYIKDLESEHAKGELSYIRMFELIEEEVIKNYLCTGLKENTDKSKE